MQINVGIIAASIPTLKPLLKRKPGTLNANQYNRYDDIEKPKTIGSERRSKPCRSILSTLGTRTDTEVFELATQQDWKNDLYSVGQERVGSEDIILESDAQVMNLLLVPTSSTIATTLYYPTHTYIAALLHSYSINSVLHYHHHYT
jgi:hypothetical protein